VRQRSHDSLDEGYRSREAAEADYRYDNKFHWVFYATCSSVVVV